MTPTVWKRILLLSGDGTGPRRCDLLLENGLIAEISDRIPPPEDAAVLDWKGALVMPAFTDVGAALFDPDFPQRETPVTAAAAAAAGGYRRVAARPDGKGRPADPKA